MEELHRKVEISHDLLQNARLALERRKSRSCLSARPIPQNSCDIIEQNITRSEMLIDLMSLDMSK